MAPRSLPEWDTEGQQLLKSARGQLADGVQIVEDLNSIDQRLKNVLVGLFPNTPSVSTALLGVAQTLDAWLKRTYPNIVATAEAAKPKAWKQEQLEYGFSFDIKDPSGKGGTLRSDNYTDGQLDWADFTWSGDPTLPNAIQKAESFVPTSVKYQGMPSPRFWEMEDRRVNFGKISAASANLFSMVFSEFGLAYSNDWFWIPMPLKINTLCRIEGLTITNVFGEKITYPAPDTSATDPLSRKLIF